MTMKLLTSRAKLAVAVAALATLSLAACGSDPPTSATGSSSESGSANASGLACPSGKLSAEGLCAKNAATKQIVATLLTAGFWSILAPLPLALTVALTALEVLVAVLQAYVFATLTSIYLNDALHPGH